MKFPEIEKDKVTTQLSYDCHNLESEVSKEKRIKSHKTFKSLTKQTEKLRKNIFMIYREARICSKIRSILNKRINEQSSSENEKSLKQKNELDRYFLMFNKVNNHKTCLINYSLLTLNFIALDFENLSTMEYQKILFLSQKLSCLKKTLLKCLGNRE